MSEDIGLPNIKGESKNSNSHHGELREYEKLDSLLSQIPKKAQHGLMMSCDLVLTCIDANSFFIALGSNIGVVFLYSRKDHTVQRIRVSSTNEVITCVRLHHGIDDQLAFATASGALSVYFFPGITSVHRKQVEKFEVKDIHKHYVTCLEWSTNGMKLYSGDKNGLVVTTEVDFYEDECRSSLLLVETATEIVQLDYKHRILLVSTRQRSFIVRTDLKCQVVTIGTKDRKIPGPFGACFLPEMCKADDAKLYAARPGCRLWLSDVSGVVINTYIFTDPLSASVPEIPLLSAGKLQVGQSEFQFGILKCFRGKEIVTWSNTALVVLDPEANKGVARQGRLSGIVDVAVVEDTGEIFLLRRHADARVVRIAATSEPKPARVETVPTFVVEKNPPKEEKDRDNPAQAFFKKLTKPLKTLDKAVLSDSKQEAKIPESTKTDTLTSPDLPPVVRLASPELEGVRMFTGGSVTSDGIGDSSGVLPVITSDQVQTFDLAVSAMDAFSVTVPCIKTDTVSEEYPVLTNGQNNKFESIPSAEYKEEDNIVFAHRMKKHKKKKTKEGFLVPKYKDEDSVSVVSGSSQLSDDTTVSSSNSSVPSANDTSLSVLQSADEVLTLVDTLLKTRDCGSLLSQPGEEHVSSETTVAGSLETVVVNGGTPLTSEKLDISESLETSLEGKIEDNLIDNTMVVSKSICNEAGKESSEKVDDFSRYDVTDGSLKSASNGVNLKGLPVYDSSDKSKDVGTSLLSECDQHLEMEKEVVKKSAAEEQKITHDASVIVESAIANLMKSAETSLDIESQSLDSSRPTVESVSVKSRLSAQMSFQDIYSGIEEIESTDPFHKGYRRGNADDFYSLFLDTSPESPVSPVGKPSAAHLSHTMARPSETERDTEMQDVSERRLANTWSEFTTPGNIYSLSLSNSHIWFTDKSENIYYSSVGSAKGIQWRKATGQASQISVSPSGHIVWRLHRGVVYAGTKINARHPEGLKWVEAVRDVARISVDNDCAWFVMNNGDVLMQRKLSADRPCYKSQKVKCAYRLKQIHARHGVIWAITDELSLLVRTGVCDEFPEGNEWELDERIVPPYLFSHVALDNEKIGWAIDVLGHIWFCDGVTRQEPLGRRRWWQVPLSEYVLHDQSTMDTIRGLARKFDPTKLSYILTTNRGGLITAGTQGVWLALNFRNVLQVCRGNVQGYHWLEAQPAQMSPSTTWKQVCAEISHLDWGLVWAQHANGDIFTFKGAGLEASIIPDCPDFTCMAVGPTATWAVTSDGGIYVRAGMDASCPRGTEWVKLDITQLGDAHIVHISCNSLYVWAVEADGTVYQRIGAKPPSEHYLSPAWLAVDTFTAIVFSRVHTGPLDWMVWAFDNRRLVYVRAGITENMPIGQEWVHVPGIQAIDLALTRTGVWALTPHGEIFFRYGIARDRPCGNYWKKIPGVFVRISASANDELWGINTEGQLMQCSVKFLTRVQENSDPLPQSRLSTSSSVSEDVDWEIV